MENTRRFKVNRVCSGHRRIMSIRARGLSVLIMYRRGVFGFQGPKGDKGYKGEPVSIYTTTLRNINKIHTIECRIAGRYTSVFPKGVVYDNSRRRLSCTPDPGIPRFLNDNQDLHTRV